MISSLSWQTSTQRMHQWFRHVHIVRHDRCRRCRKAEAGRLGGQGHHTLELSLGMIDVFRQVVQQVISDFKEFNRLASVRLQADLDAMSGEQLLALLEPPLTLRAVRVDKPCKLYS